MAAPHPARKAVTSRSAAAWAQNQILDLLANGSLGADQKLPAERDLATWLGVSRASVREAISALVTLGVLEARHGAGVFVTSLDPVALLSSFAPVLAIIATQHAEDLARLHSHVEAGAAARAASRAAPADLGPLRQAIAELRLADVEPETRHAEDGFRRTIWRLSDERFHRAIAHLAGDPVAEGMTALLRHTRDQLLTDAPPRDLRAHERLFQAIVAGEPELASATARTLVLEELASPAAEVSPQPDLTRPGGSTERFTALSLPPTASTAGSGRLERRQAPTWFSAAKFGVIVHWGIYSIPGWAPLGRDDATGGVGEDDRHGPAQHPFAEWYQASAAVPGSRTAEHHERTYGGSDYREFRAAFEATLLDWDPEAWARQFAQAGARYVVQVAKHHDGFLLWPSRVRHPLRSDWRASRDVVGELAAAVRRHHLRYGLFYSSGVDWSFGSSPPVGLADVLTSSPPGQGYARYVEAQWRELIQDYAPDGLWNDTGYPAAGDAPRLLRDYYAAVNDGVVSDRFRVPDLDGAGTTSGADRPWESIRPIGRSFGWNRQETADDVLSGAEIVLLLMDVVSSNRNLLLGVSPDDRGRLPQAQATSLAQVGRWLDTNGAAVFGTTPWSTPRSTTADGRSVFLTQGDGTLFVTIEGDPSGEVVIDHLRLDRDATVATLGTETVLDHRPADRGSTIVVPSRLPTSGAATVLRIDRPPTT